MADTTRPLLKTADPKGTLATLIDQRYPTYAQADIIVQSRDAPQPSKSSESTV